MNQLYCFHGFLGSPADWNALTTQIAPTPTTCMEIPIQPTWDRGISALADSIAQNSILCGYSMGARIALATCFALADRGELKRLRGLVFVSGNPGILLDKDRELRLQHDQRIAEQLRTCRVEPFLRSWYQQPVFAGLSDAQIDNLVTIRSKIDRAYQADLLATYSIGWQPDYWPRLKSLELPVLIMTGDRDTKYCDIARKMLATLPKAQHHTVSDCGHNVPFEQPDVFAKRLQPFLAQASLFQP